MFMTLTVVPQDSPAVGRETFVITDPFRIADGIAAGLKAENALDDLLVFLCRCRRDLTEVFGDVAVFVSFDDMPMEREPEFAGSLLAEYPPSVN